jgi:hypothetical protein
MNQKYILPVIILVFLLISAFLITQNLTKNFRGKTIGGCSDTIEYFTDENKNLVMKISESICYGDLEVVNNSEKIIIINRTLYSEVSEQ